MRRSIIWCGVAAVLHLAAGVAAAGEWRLYAGGPRRLFFNPAETTITSTDLGALEIKWTFATGAIVTASPSVAVLDLPGEGRLPVAFIQSWDGHLYALRVRNGTEVWRFAADVQPGKPYPNVSSAAVQEIDGSERVYFSAGETVYALDAVGGTEIWRFDAGTGCVDPPGLCGFDGERNEVESSPIVAGGLVLFGMDVNDRDGGKGGFYGVDARDGRLAWFFDLESGVTCRPLAGETIRRFDGYHSEIELGLPAGFFATRPGCGVDRTGTGCGNVWSSAAVDVGRGLLYVASSNCDTDANPATVRPPPPMPPYDEAIFALDLAGNPVWRWRPREVDNADLAFGATPNLFTIGVDVGGTVGPRDVVGIGNKDGTYYVIDRDGVNAASGVRWDDADPSGLPYWSTQVVPGGAIGGIIGTAAVDEARGRIYFSTAPGFDPLAPQRPTVHALDLQTGAIVWQNTSEVNADASFGPTSAIPGAVFVGKVIGGVLRAYDPDTGERRAAVSVGSAVASAPAVVDGIVMVGAGIGERNANPQNISDITSRIPQNVTGLCVAGTPACARVSPFSCYRTRSAGPFRRVAGVSVADRFGARRVDVIGIDDVCNPADADGADPAVPSDPEHLQMYRLRQVPGEPRVTPVRGVVVTDAFGTRTVDVLKSRRLLVPSAVSVVDDPPVLPAAARIDRFQCHRIRATRGTPRFASRATPQPVALADEFGTNTVRVKRPRWLCSPANVNGGSPVAPTRPEHLLCYRTSLVAGTPRGATPRPAFVNARDLGPGTLDVIRPRVLCVPAQVDDPESTTTSSSTTTTTTTSTTASSTTTTTLVFTWAQVQSIFAGECSACHGGAEVRGGLGGLDDFDQGYDNLVGVPSTQLPGMDRVEPFDAATSYLMHKLDGTHLVVGGSGGQMPPGNPLGAADRNGIRAWIEAGAAKVGGP